MQLRWAVPLQSIYLHMPAVTTKCGRLSLSSIHRCEWMSRLPEEVLSQKQEAREATGRNFGKRKREKGVVCMCHFVYIEQVWLQSKHSDRIHYLECDLTCFVFLFIAHHIPVALSFIQTPRVLLISVETVERDGQKRRSYNRKGYIVIISSRWLSSQTYRVATLSYKKLWLQTRG